MHLQKDIAKHILTLLKPSKSITHQFEASLQIKSKYPERTILISFEDLVQSTKELMEGICDQLNIDFEKILTRPTYNSHLIKSNSSFKNTYRIDSSVVNRTPEKPIKSNKEYKRALKCFMESKKLLV